MPMKPKVLYYSVLDYQPENIEMLHDHFTVIALHDPDEDTPEILQDVVVTFAPLGFYCGEQKIDLCPRLKVIASNTTGDAHIDVQYAASKGITVITLNEERAFLETITPTAEHTWGLLLALTRLTPWAFDSVKSGIWNRRLFPGNAMLSSMSLGIIGLGRLGSMVARYGQCFGMKVKYYDPYVDSSPIHGAERVQDLMTLVNKNDVISLHAPYNDETEKMLNSEVFLNFKRGSYFINSARAEIVDFAALLEALNSGRLAGAAMDVFQQEFQKGFSGSQQFKNHPLLEYARNHDNLLLTPHIGGSTIDAWKKTEEHTLKKIIEFLNRPPSLL